MKAGDLYIAVSAQMGAFNAQMAEVEMKTAQTGKMAGLNFSDQFEASTQKIATNFVKQFASPMIVASIADTVAKGLREGFSIEKVGESLKQLPFAGSFVNLGGAVFDSLESVRGDVNDWYRSVGLGFMADVNEAVYGVAISTEKQMIAAQAAAEEQQSIAQSAKAAEESYKKIADIEEQRKRAAISRGTSERQSILELARLDMERIADENREYMKLQEDRITVLDGAARDAVQQELDAAKALRDARIAQVIEERDLKLKALDEAFVRETEQQMQLAAKRQEQMEKEEQAARERSARMAESTSKELVGAFEKQMSDLEDQITDVEAKRMGVATSTTALSTALGSFTISSYTDEEKKKNDETLVKEVKQLRRSMENVGAGGGFR